MEINDIIDNISFKDFIELILTLKIKKVLNINFLDKTKFWRINWINKECSFSRGDQYFINNRKELNSIIDFWNNNIHENKNYSNYHYLRYMLSDKRNCEEEFITDNEKNKHKIIINEIKR